MNMGAWNTVRNYIDRTLEMVNFGDKILNIQKSYIFYCDWKFEQHLAQQKEILEKILKD